MKKYLITCAALTLLAVSACKKSSQNLKQTTTDPTCKLTSILLGAGGIVTANENLIYDAQGRLIKDSIGVQPFNFSYTDNKITIKTGNTIINLTLENGRVTNYADNTGATETVTYNSDGYLNTVTYYQNGILFATDSRTYTNGNLTGLKKIPGPGNPSGSTLIESFEYDATKVACSLYVANPMYYTTPFYIAGLYGKEPKGLLIKYSSTLTYYNNLFDDSTEDFTYDKDPATGNYSIVTTHTIGVLQAGVSPGDIDYKNAYKLTYTCDK